MTVGNYDVKVPFNTGTKFNKNMPADSELGSEDTEHMPVLKAYLFLLQERKHTEHKS
jgi:hypothetical protein